MKQYYESEGFMTVLLLSAGTPNTFDPHPSIRKDDDGNYTTEWPQHLVDEYNFEIELNEELLMCMFGEEGPELPPPKKVESKEWILYPWRAEAYRVASVPNSTHYLEDQFFLAVPNRAGFRGLLTSVEPEVIGDLLPFGDFWE